MRIQRIYRESEARWKAQLQGKDLFGWQTAIVLTAGIAILAVCQIGIPLLSFPKDILGTLLDMSQYTVSGTLTVLGIWAWLTKKLSFFHFAGIRGLRHSGFCFRNWPGLRDHPRAQAELRPGIPSCGISYTPRKESNMKISLDILIYLGMVALVCLCAWFGWASMFFSVESGTEAYGFLGLIGFGLLIGTVFFIAVLVELFKTD